MTNATQHVLDIEEQNLELFQGKEYNLSMGDGVKNELSLRKTLKYWKNKRDIFTSPTPYL